MCGIVATVQMDRRFDIQVVPRANDNRLTDSSFECRAWIDSVVSEQRCSDSGNDFLDRISHSHFVPLGGECFVPIQFRLFCDTSIEVLRRDSMEYGSRLKRWVANGQWLLNRWQRQRHSERGKPQICGWAVVIAAPVSAFTFAFATPFSTARRAVVFPFGQSVSRQTADAAGDNSGSQLRHCLSAGNAFLFSHSILCD